MNVDKLTKTINEISEAAYTNVVNRGLIASGRHRFALIDLQLEAIECEINEVRQEIFSDVDMDSAFIEAKAYQEEVADVFIAACTLLRVAGVDAKIVLDKMKYNKTREQRRF